MGVKDMRKDGENKNWFIMCEMNNKGNKKGLGFCPSPFSSPHLQPA